MKTKKSSVVSLRGGEADAAISEIATALRPRDDRQKVFVMLSGGVDSSVAAALLTDAGHDVTGVFMKNWSESIPGIVECSSQQDADDARAVAETLGIPFQIWNFEQEYRERVFEPMIAEYRAGRTPNPDVNCNAQVKFKLFFERAIAEGADYIASGHYARVSLRGGEADAAISEIATAAPRDDNMPPRFSLIAAVDKSKDQSYFLYRLTRTELSRTLFPIGDLLKSEVRKIAEQKGLITASKKDSQGLCFVGDVAFKAMLREHIPSRAGDIITVEGEKIGEHDGAEYVTVGQRGGLGVGGGTPYYVVAKDVVRNIITVAKGSDHSSLYATGLTFTDPSWTGEAPETPRAVTARVRYHSQLTPARLEKRGEEWLITFDEPVKAIAPGQAVVLYDGEEVLGGGVIVGTVNVEKTKTAPSLAEIARVV